MITVGTWWPQAVDVRRISESFLSKHEHLESVDVGKAEVGLIRVLGSVAYIRRRGTSCSTSYGRLRGLKVYRHHLKLKGAPALMLKVYEA